MSEPVNTFEAQQQGRPTGPLVQGYEVIIGFETHAQLSTASKIFSRAATAFGAEPNTQASPVDLALPGTLPVMNKGAVERAIQLGLALGSHIAPRSVFARKNYFYPDLPKGYQISQYDLPLAANGTLTIDTSDGPFTVGITRAHLEEDTARLAHVTATLNGIRNVEPAIVVRRQVGFTVELGRTEPGLELERQIEAVCPAREVP